MTMHNSVAATRSLSRDSADNLWEYRGSCCSGAVCTAIAHKVCWIIGHKHLCQQNW
jgi:hypothetical protein